MKSVFALLTVFFIPALNVVSQSPPPPLIYKAPDKSAIKKFVSAEDKFSVDLAGEPVVTKAEILNGASNLYTVKHPGSNILIKVSSFNEIIEFNPGLEGAAEQIKNRYLEREGYKLISEKSVTGGDVRGKEFVFESRFQLHKLRVFVAGSKLYEVSIDVTNWHILTNSVKEKADEFLAEAERLLSSFTIVKGQITPSPIIAERPKGGFIIDSRPLVEKDFGIKGDSYSRLTKIFNSDEGGFKIFLPAKPVRNIRTVEAAYGNTQVINYQAFTKGFVHVIAYTDMPVSLNDKLEIEAQLEAIKERALALKNSKIIKEEETKMSGYFAKQFMVETDNLTLITRGVIANQRFYQVTIIREEVFSRMSEAGKKQLITDINKFFDSFEITRLPAVKNNVVNLPDDFRVEVDGTMFSSGHLGFEMELPGQWHFLSNLDSDFVDGLARDGAKSSGEKLSKDLDLSLKNTRILLLLTKDKMDSQNQSASFTIAAEKIVFPNFLPEMVIKNFSETMLESSEKITVPLSTTTFGNKRFAWLEFKNEKNNTFQRFYVANIGGLALEFFMVYKDKKDLDLMLESMQSMLFFK